jgi:hypothetical protein
MLSRREEIEARISAFVGSWLDGAYERYGEDFDVGEVAVVFEVVFPPEQEGSAVSTEIGWTCTDSRNWVQAGLFRRAMILAEDDAFAGEELEDEETD